MLDAAVQAKRGTPCYMAPELFQDGSTHSSAADLWALGCVLYECAAGHPPFVSTSFNHLVNDILTSNPAVLPSKLPTSTNDTPVPGRTLQLQKTQACSRKNQILKHER